MSTRNRLRASIRLTGIAALVIFAASLSWPIPSWALCGMPGSPACPGELLTTYYLNAGDNLELIIRLV